MGEVRSPLQGTVVTVAEAGDTVHARTTVVVVESMKMEHSVEAGVEGTVAEVLVVVGQQVATGDLLAPIEPGSVEAAQRRSRGRRPTLRACATTSPRSSNAARSASTPPARPRWNDAGGPVSARRENVDDLLDPGSFVEYGPW